MKLHRQPARREQENTIALINIVFLMLIFFLVAGTLAPPLDKAVSMIATKDAPPDAPPDALVVDRAGQFRFRGRPTTLEDYLRRRRASAQGAADTSARLKLVVDRSLPASDLVGIVAAIRRDGVGTVTVVTERTFAP